MAKKKRRYTKPLFRAQREPEGADAGDVAAGTAVEVGDTVIRRPISFGGDGERPGREMRGTVVYVHPARRYHVVEFDLGGRKLRESFAGDGK